MLYLGKPFFRDVFFAPMERVDPSGRAHRARRSSASQMISAKPGVSRRPFGAFMLAVRDLYNTRLGRRAPRHVAHAHRRHGAALHGEPRRPPTRWSAPGEMSFDELARGGARREERELTRRRTAMAPAPEVSYFLGLAMKASVRWLRELCPAAARRRRSAIAARLTAAGLEVEGDARVRPRRRGVRRRERRLDAPAPVAQRAAARHGRPRRRAAGGRVRRAQRAGAGRPGRPRAARRAPAGEGHDDREAHHRRRPQRGDAVQRGRARPRRRRRAASSCSPPGPRPRARPSSQALPAARDTILEIGLTPNRPDGLGHVGLAREAAALFERALRSAVRRRRPRASATSDLAQYVARHDRGRRALPPLRRRRPARREGRPLAARRALAARVARRPPDLEPGRRHQPRDARDRAPDARVRPRPACAARRSSCAARPRARSSRTLDGVDRTLTADDLVICDGEGPVALAGVMGGGNSEISAETTRVLLECAYFDPRGVRRAARRHGLHTEASHRFERGVDWGDTRAVLARAASLDGAARGRRRACRSRASSRRAPLARRTVTLRHERIGGAPRRRGRRTARRARRSSASASRVASSQPGDGRLGGAELPSRRLARGRPHRGGRARARLRRHPRRRCPPSAPSRDAGPREALRRRARDAGVALGLSEAITYAFVAPARPRGRRRAARRRDPREPARASAATVMRTSLLPGLLHALAHARRHGERDARLFTVGDALPRAARAGADAPPGRRRCPTSGVAFAALLAGDRPAWLAQARGRRRVGRQGRRRGARRSGCCGATPSLRLAAADDRPQHLHPRGAAWIEVDGKRVGALGPLHPDVARRVRSGRGRGRRRARPAGARGGRGRSRCASRPLPRFPASTRDLAVVVRDGVPAGDVEHAVRAAGGRPGRGGRALRPLRRRQRPRGPREPRPPRRLPRRRPHADRRRGRPAPRAGRRRGREALRRAAAGLRPRPVCGRMATDVSAMAAAESAPRSLVGRRPVAPVAPRPEARRGRDGRGVRGRAGRRRRARRHQDPPPRVPRRARRSSRASSRRRRRACASSTRTSCACSSARRPRTGRRTWSWSCSRACRSARTRRTAGACRSRRRCPSSRASSPASPRRTRRASSTATSSRTTCSSRAAPDGTFVVKVLDFGIAKVMDAAGGMGSRTRTGMLLGTPAYMSPEQVKNARDVDQRADLWSAGVMFYEMLTGPRRLPGADRVRAPRGGARVGARARRAHRPGARAARAVHRARAPRRTATSASRRRSRWRGRSPPRRRTSRSGATAASARSPPPRPSRSAACPRCPRSSRRRSSACRRRPSRSPTARRRRVPSPGPARCCSRPRVRPAGRSRAPPGGGR